MLFFDDFLNEEKEREEEIRDDHYFNRIDKGEVSGLKFRNWEKISHYIKLLQANPEGMTLTKLVGVNPITKQKENTNSYARHISWLYLKKLITIKKGERRGQAHTIKPTEKLLALTPEQLENPLSIGNREFLSSKIIEVLEKFPKDDKIAQFILSLENNKEALQHLYLNIEGEPGMVSFLPSNREKNVENEEYWKNRYRQTTSIGKLVRALMQKEGQAFADVEIERFGNTFKSIQLEVTVFKNFKLVQGQDIRKWYNYSTYQTTGFEESPLNKSCMKHDKCDPYFTVYTDNPNVSLLILLNDEGKLMGRAIVWNGVEMEDGKKITFMDRIYYNSEAEVELFKTFAKRKNWWFKVVQSHRDSTISNGTISYSDMLKFELPNVGWSRISKPYLDTLKYFNNTTGSSSNGFKNSDYRLLEPGEKVIITDEVSKYGWEDMVKFIGKTFTIRDSNETLFRGTMRGYYFTEGEISDYFVPADCVEPLNNTGTYKTKVKEEKKSKYFISSKMTDSTKQQWSATDGTYKRV